jgi:Ribbon-helix-helix domain
MSRKKISTTIYVTPEQSEQLRLLHDRTKVPVAVYIREGIDLVLRHYSHLLPGQLPLDRAGDRDGLFDPPPLSPASGEPKAASVRQERASATDAADRSASRAGSKV